MPPFEVPGIREFPQGTHTAQQAADAIGVAVGQIVKSLVFRRADGAAALVLCSGSNTVDADRLELAKADAAFVRTVTGQAIGGVAPFGHPAPIATVVDEDLLGYDEVWASAGTPQHVFPIAPADLVARTNGSVARVKP